MIKPEEDPVNEVVAEGAQLMRFLFAAIATAILATPTLAASGEGQWICEADFSGGVRYDEPSKEWVGTRFKADDRFVIKSTFRGVEKRFSYESDIYDVTISEFGSKDAPLACDSVGGSGASTFPGMAAFTCDWGLQEVRINFETGRFLISYMIGYIGGDDNNDNTPSITGGTCAKF